MGKPIAIWIGWETPPLESIPPGCWAEWEPHQGWWMVYWEDAS